MRETCNDPNELNEVSQLLAQDEIIFTPIYSHPDQRWQYHVDFPDGDFAIICTGPEIDARWFALQLWDMKIYEQEHVC